MTAPAANALLGYPPEARLLIVNADDFGMCHSVNVAAIRTIEAGLVGSVSLMVPCPWAWEAMAFLKEHLGLSFAVHLTMLRDFDVYRWGPVCPSTAVRSLVDRAGFFPIHADRNSLLQRARIDDVEREFRAQIELVLAEGLTPSHLDWHSLADGGREDIFALTIDLAWEYGLALRVHDASHGAALRTAGLPVVDHPVLDSYHMDPAAKHQQFFSLIQSLPPGLTEWAVHPSLGSAEARALEPETWQVRQADYRFLTSDAGIEAVRDSGVVLMDYRELQAAWRAQPAG